MPWEVNPMIRFLAIIAIIGAFCYFGYKILFAPQTATDRTQQGVAMMFISATMADDKAKIEGICEPAAAANAVNVSKELRPLLADDSGLSWQKVRPASGGQDAIQAQISGKGKILIVEVNQHGDSWKIQSVGLAAI